MSGAQALATQRAAPGADVANITLQRTCACEATGETCSRCAGKQKPLQRLATGGMPQGMPSAVGNVLRTAGRPLPAATRLRMEAGFGRDFSAVRIHGDTAAQRSAAAVNARAYTVGQHIVLGASAPALSSSAGDRLVGHEIAHVVQQSGGGVGHGIDPDPMLETEAQRAGDAIAAGRTFAVSSSASTMIQRDEEPQTEHPNLEKVVGLIGRGLGFGEGTSRVVAASLEGGLSGFSHQWNEGGTSARLGKKVEALSWRDYPALVKGYLVGALEGIVSPITDLFNIGVLIESLIDFTSNLAISAITRAVELAGELKGITDAISKLGQPIKDWLKGLRKDARGTFHMIVDWLGSSGSLADKAVGIARTVSRSQGESVAKSLESPWEAEKQEPQAEAVGPLSWLAEKAGRGRDEIVNSPWAKVGNKAGYALGFAVIQVLLLMFTEGIGNLIVEVGRGLGGLAKAGSVLGRTIEGVAKFVTTAGSVIAKVEGWVNAAMTALMKPLMPLLDPLLKPLAGVMERLGGFLRKLFGIAEKDASKVAAAAATKALGGAHPPAVEPHLPGGTPHAPSPHVAPPPHATAPATSPVNGEPHVASKPAGEPHVTAKPSDPLAPTHPAGTEAGGPHPVTHEPNGPGKTGEPHPATRADPKTPHPGSDAAHKPLADPEPVGGGHHSQMTPEGFELCSPPPCPNLRLIYQKQLKRDADLLAELETLDAKRRLIAKLEADGRPDKAFAKKVSQDAAKLQQKLEAARLNKGPKTSLTEPSAPAKPVIGSSSPAPGEALVGSSKSQMRRRAAKLIREDPDHPLSFLLDARGKFRPQRGLKHVELLDRPDLVQMGHIRSDKLGEEEFLMLQGAWENQFNAVTVESAHMGGAVADQGAVSIGGIAIDLKTAQYWENVGLLKKGTIAKSPRIKSPVSGSRR